MIRKTNFSFLLKNSLTKVTIAGLVLWILFFFLVPLSVKKHVGWIPVFYLLINYFVFIIGLNIIPSVKKENRDTYKVNKNTLRKVLYIIILIAVIGLFFKVLDKFYIRGASFSNSISLNRIILEKSGASIISIIAAVLNPFSFLPLFIYYYLGIKNRLLLIFCYFLFFSTAFEFIMLGSRAGLFVMILLLIIYLRYFKKLKISLTRVFVVSLIMIFVMIFSVQLFIERTKDFAKTDKVAVEHILTRSGYNFTVEPTKEAKHKIINTKNKTVQAFRLGLMNFGQYYLHGVFEFGYLYNNYKKNYWYGGYTFNIFAKFINIVFRTNINLKEIQQSPPRTGVYTTFFGPIFIDFGWFSLVFIFFFGVFQKLIHNKILQGRFQFTPLLFYLLIINFFMPVFNFINGAQGLYNLISFGFFAIIYILLTGKLKLSNKNGKQQYFKALK